MEKEISSGAMLGIVLIALAAVIGLGFGVFAIAKSTANEGIVGVQDSLAQVADSTFSDFDQKTVTGSQVKSFISTMSGKSYAMLVATTAGQKAGTAANAVPVYALTDTVEGETGAAVYFVNYGAILKHGDECAYDATAGLTTATAGVALSEEAGVTECSMILTNGVWGSGADDAEVTLAIDTNNKIQFNNQTSGLTTVGTGENVPDATKFKANLIKDTSGTIKGVVFEQIVR
jgi:hypothetical protein